MADIAPIDVQAAPRPLPTPYADTPYSPQGFGDSIGSAVEQGADVLGNVTKEARDKANVSATLAARGIADNTFNQKITSDVTGFRALKGHDAMAGADDALNQFGGQGDQIGGALGKVMDSLSNDDQKRAFAGYALQLKQEAFRLVQTHLTQQSQLIDADAYKGAQSALINKLGSLPVAMDPVLRQAQFDEIEKNATARAQQIFGRSASPSDIANFTVAARHLGVEQVLDTLKGADTPQALDEAKRVITDPKTRELLGGARTSTVESEIYRRDDQQQGLAAAQAAARASLMPGTTVVTEDADKMIDQLSQRSDMRPTMIKVAREALDRMKLDGRRIEDSRSFTAFTQGLDAVRKGDNNGLQKSLDTLSVADGTQQRGELFERLMNFQSAQTKRLANTPAAQRQQAFAYADAESILGNTRASDTSLQEFLTNNSTSDGRPLAEALSGPNISKLTVAFEKKKTQEAADKPLDKPANDLIKQNLADALDFPTTSGIALSDEQIAERNHVQDYVRQQRNAWIEQNPKKEPGAEQYQEWINDQIGRVPGTGGFFSRNTRRVDLEIQQAQARTAAQSSPDASAAAPTPAATAPTAPAPKNVRSYRYTADRKKRAPVYSDGTQGPLEDSP